MAIHLPSNLYSEGQVPLNSNGFTNFYLQEKSKQRARKDAYDAYYRDLGKGLSPAGMAANDIPDFMNKIQGWKQFTIQNRDVLNDPRNPKYADAVTQAQYLYNDALEHAETSKSKVKDLYQARQLIKPDHPFTDATMNALHQGGAPISQGYQPIDLGSIEYDEKPYDFISQQKDIDAALKGVQLGKQVASVKSDPRTHTNTVTYDFQYNKDALNDIAHRAATAYQTNPKVKKWLDNQVVDMQQYNALNPTFKEAFGRDIQSGEDKYAAMLLQNAKQPYQQQQVQGYNPYLGMGGGSGGANGASNINDVYGKIENQVNNDFSKGYGTRINALDSDAQAVIVDFAKKATGDNDINYADMILQKSPDGSIGLYKAEQDKKTGRFKVGLEQLIATLPRVGTNLKVQPSVQEKRKVIQEGNPKKTTPKKSEKDPLGLF